MTFLNHKELKNPKNIPRAAPPPASLTKLARTDSTVADYPMVI